MRFNYCTSLTNITIPSSLTNIGSGAFLGCGLTTVMIPDTVTRIGVQAFGFCTSLTNALIGNGVTYISGNAFDQCSNLTAITVSASNSIYSGVDGVLLDRV